MKKIIILLLFPLFGFAQISIKSALEDLTSNPKCVDLEKPIIDTLQKVVIRDGFLKMETVVRIVTAQKDEYELEKPTYHKEGVVFAVNAIGYIAKTVKVPCKSHYEDLKGNKIQVYSLIAEW